MSNHSILSAIIFLSLSTLFSNTYSQNDSGDHNPYDTMNRSPDTLPQDTLIPEPDTNQQQFPDDTISYDDTPAAYENSEEELLNDGDTAFNPETIDSVTGLIQSMDSVPGENNEKIIEVMLFTDNIDGTERIIASTAPRSYFDDIDLELMPDDSITVIGSMITDQRGEQMIIVSQIIKNDQFYLFRDAEGKPFWEQMNDLTGKQ
jgi:hypothetical protein